MAAKKTARGVRNNNPGNIDFNTKNQWQGQTGIEPGPNARFATFKSMEYGVRALAVLCVTYYDKHKCDTLFKFFNRYAPSQENNTRAYAAAVSKDLTEALNVPVTIYTAIDLHDYCTLRTLICGIIEHENGVKKYTDIVSDAQIDKGLTLAGVEPPKKPLAKTATMRNAAVLGTTGTSAVVAGVSKAIEDHSQTVATAVPVVDATADLVEDHYQTLFIGFGCVVIACAIFMAVRRWKDRQNGVR